ncbi:MAG TPA: hypothetical protein PLG94_15930 [Smithellaceae bacterium]|nr:hypothetical protein [Smithellaceae bacterium]
MDLFGKKRIEELEAKILELEAVVRTMRDREAALAEGYERRKKDLDERERVLFDRGLAHAGQLDRLQKKFRRIRTTAMRVRAGEVSVENLLKEILHGKVR